MQFSQTAVEAATILAERRHNGAQGERLPDACRPTEVAAALAIQQAVSARIGDAIGGWKCALPADGNPVLGPIYAASIFNRMPCPAWAHRGDVRIEPELAFILGQDLPARATPYAEAEVDAAVARTHLALELIDSRYETPELVPFLEHLADGLLNQGLYLGPEVDAARGAASTTLAIELRSGAGAPVHLDGRHPATLPRAPLYWLVEFLRQRGQGLTAGQAIITGSYAGSVTVPLGREIEIAFGALGVLTVHFQAR